MTHLLCGPFRVVAFAGLIQVRFIMVSAPEDLTKLRPHHPLVVGEFLLDAWPGFP